MRRRSLINKEYAEHWSEEPRSMQYQNFLALCRNSFSQNKNLFNPKERFSALSGESNWINEFNYQYKKIYKDEWSNIQNKFESCLRRNNPITDNIIDCWNNEYIKIELLHDEFFYIERWELFKMDLSEKLNTLDRNHDLQHIFKETKIIKILEDEIVKIKSIKQMGWKSMVSDWIEHQKNNLDGYSKMNKKEWLHSERISEIEFASAERYVRSLKI